MTCMSCDGLNKIDWDLGLPWKWVVYINKNKDDMAHHITTRKSTKTNEIIDKNFLSVIFIDGKNFRLHLCQYIPRDNTHQRYGRSIPMEYVCWYIPTVSPTNYIIFLKSCNDMMMWIFFGWFYRRNDRGIQTGISVQWHGTFTGEITDGYTDRNFPSVIPSVKVNIYPLCRHSIPLFSFFFPIPPPPLKLQPTTHPNSPPLLNTSTQVSYTFVRGHNIRSCGFYQFL